MQFNAVVFAAAFAGLAQAQSACLSSAEAIPSCGQSCLIAAASSYGCASTDFACQCSHSSQINNAALTSCVLSGCNNDVSSALAVSSDAIALCSCVATAAPGSSGPATTAAIPSTTNAISVTMAPGASSSAATPTVAMQSAGSSSAISKFTGGAVAATGSVGGVFAAVLGLIAAL